MTNSTVMVILRRDMRIQLNNPLRTAIGARVPG